MFAPDAPEGYRDCMTPAAHWRDYSREDVLGAIEEATGAALSANDPLPDSLIANAQALGLTAGALRLYIYDEPARDDWSINAMAAWAAKYALMRR